jgi:flagellar hook-length control protein FliK
MNSPAATPATILQKDTAPEPKGIQTSGAGSADSDGSVQYSSFSDASFSGQGKSGQQSGSGSADNPAGAKAFASSLAASQAPDPAGNLLTAHAPTIPANHTITSTTPPNPSSSTPPGTTLSAWQNYDGGAGKIVRSAAISESATGAEMHVELRSGTLGPMDVHAMLREGSVGAEIHVQGQEAHSLLSAGLPSLERALGERNLRVESVAVYQDHAGGGMSGGEKQDSHGGSSPSPQRQVMPWDAPPLPHSGTKSSLEGEESPDPAAGLSVRA